MIIILLGYGVLLKLECQKFRLNPADENDIHFISHFNQKLYSMGHEPKTNDEYCVEFAQLPSGDVKVFFLKLRNLMKLIINSFSDVYLCMLFSSKRNISMVYCRTFNILYIFGGNFSNIWIYSQGNFIY